uniref:FBD domain-containing protein n=1 Tax=Oryza punctata TaxID=4537 RepID=A0A0E0JKS3_ORYPU
MDAAGEEGDMTYGEVVDYFNSLQDPPAQERIDCIIPYLISLLPAPFSIPPYASPDIANCVDVWESLGSCECLKSHLKTISLQGFQTECYEVLCLKYLVLEGEVLETVAFFCEDKVSFAAKDDEAAEIKLMFPKNLGKDRWSFQSAIDLSLDDPFYALEN